MIKVMQIGLVYTTSSDRAAPYWSMETLIPQRLALAYSTMYLPISYYLGIMFSLEDLLFLQLTIEILLKKAKKARLLLD